MIISFVLLMVSQTLALVGPYIFGNIIDAIIGQVIFRKTLILVYIWIGVFIFNDVILNHCRERYELKNLDFEMYRHVKNETMQKITEFSVGQHRNENSGLKTSIITKGQNDINMFVQMIMFEIAPIFFRIVLTTIALFYLNVSLGGIVFVGMAIFLLSVARTNIVMGPQIKNINDLVHKDYKTRSEMISNMEIVKINAQEKYSSKECDSSYGKVCDRSRETWIRYYLAVAGGNLIVGITRFLVLFVGAYYVYQRVCSAGQLVIFLSWSGDVFGSMANIGYTQRKCLELYASVKKYFIMFDIDPDINVVPNSIRPEKFKGKIEFKNISFKYSSRKYIEDKNDFEPLKKNDLNAISDISFAIEPGQKVAFVGHSGVGKTTII